MGIVKVASGIPITKSSYSWGDEDLTQEERMLLQSFPSHESDEYERAEVDCELAMSGGQMCNVPYGLYDLPELRDILSLDTWNLCLTEDDRFHLTAYLPDMDQHDFFTTMKELFSDSAMFFGNPLRSFFHRLNGGFYSPEVFQGREVLMIFQRRRHYHFLKSYHDGMILKFASMDKLWRSCDMSTGHQEKVQIWHKRQYEKPLTFVDLNSSPFNENLPIISEDKDTTCKRIKPMDGTVTTHISAKHKHMVHRAKSMEMDLSKNHILHLPNEPGEKCIKLPKGVLKIRTDCTSLTDDKAGMHRTPGLVPLGQLGMQVSTFSPYASAHGVQDSATTSYYSYNINTSRSTWGDSPSSPWQWEGALDAYPILVKSPLGVQNTVLEELKRGNRAAMVKDFYQSAPKHSAAYSSEAYDTREFPHEKNLLENFGRQNAVIPESYQSSPDPCARTTDDHQTNRYMKVHSPENSACISEMLALGTSTNPPCNNFAEQSKTMHKYHDELKMKTPATIMFTKVEGHSFPYTYTRRKPNKRLDSVDPDKKSTIVDSESPNVLASIANVKVKAIKL